MKRLHWFLLFILSLVSFNGWAQEKVFKYNDINLGINSMEHIILKFEKGLDENSSLYSRLTYESKAYQSGGTLVIDTITLDPTITRPTYPLNDRDNHSSMHFSLGARVYIPKGFSNNNLYFNAGLNYELLIGEVPESVKNEHIPIGLNFAPGYKFYITEKLNLDFALDFFYNLSHNLDANFQRRDSKFHDLDMDLFIGLGYTLGGRNPIERK